MNTRKQTISRRTVQAASGAAALLFVIIGIAQGEIVLGIVWAGAAALLTWALVATGRSLVRWIGSRRARYAVPEEQEETEPGEAATG